MKIRKLHYPLEIQAHVKIDFVYNLNHDRSGFS